MQSYPTLDETGMSQDVASFTSVRNLTATGFWTSQMGTEDLQYMGSTVVPEWTERPPERLRRLVVDDA